MPYRILSLDGGGPWALIEVRALIALYSDTTPGHTVLADFDLVAANSGGSIVLGGLVENLTLGQIRDYFLDDARRNAVFTPTRSIGDSVLRGLTGLGPRYDTAAKLPALERLMPNFGDRPLPGIVAGIRRSGGAADVHLLIVGFDYDRNRASFFRSAAASGPQWGEGQTTDISLAEAIHASTNAPVNFFDAPATFPHHPGRYWDGGVTGQNNPVMAAVTEALVLGQPPNTIVALSLGTGTVHLPWPANPQAPNPYELTLPDPSLINDLRKLATAILDDPPDAATFIAHAMTAAGAGLPPPLRSRIVRMNPLISPRRNQANAWGPPPGMTAAQFAYLMNVPMDATEPGEIAAIVQLADLWLTSQARNQPIRMNADTLVCELGHEAFIDAKTAWETLR